MVEIYDKNRMKVRTNVQQVNTLFEMGKELESYVDSVGPSSFDIVDMGDYLKFVLRGYMEFVDRGTYYELVY